MSPNSMSEVSFSSLGINTVVLPGDNRGSSDFFQIVWRDYKDNTSIMPQPVPSKPPSPTPAILTFSYNTDNDDINWDTLAVKIWTTKLQPVRTHIHDVVLESY
jgi:hypothetical protein